MPKVSVVVPVFGVEKYLDRCVESLVNQTLRDVEIILVDDGSPDRCPELCDAWSRRDSRIKVVHKKNAGLGMACNSGIEAATGDFIAFCDSDDWVDPDCYEVMLDAAVRHGAQAVYCGIKRADGHGNVLPMSQAEETKVFEGDGIREFMLDMVASPPQVKIERRRQMSAKIVLYSGEVIRANHLRFHSERQYISEDLLFNLDFLLCCSRIVELARTFYYYFTNELSISSKFRSDRFEKYKVLREYMRKRYDVPGMPERADRMFIGYSRGACKKIVASSLQVKEKLHLLGSVCSDPLWIQIGREFPVRRLNFAKRIITRLIIGNHPWLLYLALNIAR